MEICTTGIICGQEQLLGGVCSVAAQVGRVECEVSLGRVECVVSLGRVCGVAGKSVRRVVLMS